MLRIDGMQIERVVVHTIPTRGLDRSYVAPSGGGELLALDARVRDLVAARIAKALGSHAHGIEAAFTDIGADSMFQRACRMMDSTVEEFIAHAQESAERLARVQQSKSLAPAKLITMAGRVSAQRRSFVAFIKAEMEQALNETQQNGRSVLELLETIFMTESQRLFKIGLVARTTATGMAGGQYAPDHHSIHIFDHVMTGTESRKAAFYFYGEFLGADVAASDKRLTQDFFEKTLYFINSHGFSTRRRIELSEALRSEMRSNRNTLLVAEFARHNLSEREGAAYVGHMERSGFPQHAITKDVDYVKHRLRRRKVLFSNGVSIMVPPEEARAVQISDNRDGTTTVLVRGTVDSDE